jgi:hypothetical protein
MERHIYAICYGVHTKHSCLKSDHDTPPKEGGVLVRVCKHMYIYTVSVNYLQRFCEVVDTEHELCRRLETRVLYRHFRQ